MVLKNNIIDIFNNYIKAINAVIKCPSCLLSREARPAI